MKRALSIVAALAALAAFAAGSPPPPKSGPVTAWLTAGPLVPPKLVYGKESPEEAASRLLGPATLDPAALWPEAGASLAWAPGRAAAWAPLDAAGGTVAPRGEGTLLYAATYLRTARWTKATLKVGTPCAVAIYLDGARVAQRLKADEATKEPPETAAELVLPTGLHRLLVAVLAGKGAPAFTATLEVPGTPAAPLPEATSSPIHALAQMDVLAAPFVSDLALSGDGSKVALSIRRTDVAEDARSVNLEVRDTRDGRLLLDYRAARGSASPQFSPDGSKLAFTAPHPRDKESQDLWLLDLASGRAEPLLEKQKGIKTVRFAPSGDRLYFLAQAPKEKPEKAPPYERWTQLYQRWTDWNDRPQVYQLALKDRIARPLTAGQTNAQDFALSPDGRRLAVVRTVFGEARPYLTGEVWVCDLASGDSRRVLAWPRWPDLSEVAWSPDGTKLALVAPPSDLPPGGAKPREHMAYDLSLFVLDAAGGEPVRLLERARPSVTSQVTGAPAGRRNLWWNPRDNLLYFVATDRDRVRLLKTDPAGKGLEAVPLPDATLGSPDLSADGGSVAYSGSSFGTTWTVRFAELATGKVRDLYKPGEEVWSRVRLGATEPFDILARDGVPVQGWLFYPPDFDPKRKYPLVVAYYGGVLPYAECFRPEFFWLSGQGYVVYLVTPRGSVGYGREFADAHMNDWGREAGQDILEGVRAVLKHKPFLDGAKVGCYGGSYGGFMTLYLVSHSDLFAAGVDFFGISNLASYWGAGWWGFNYGDTALATSYPWTRPDLFVEQSPLFHADRIKAAVLLLHGDADTNVPPQESDQIFTALRVLGRSCEYVRFAGEDHGINGKPSNRMASEAMMLEWFDKQLKGQPEAWDHRWSKDPVPIEKE